MDLYAFSPEVLRLTRIGDVGLYFPELWADYSSYGIGSRHIPELIRVLELIADYPYLDQEGDAANYLPIHAWRALSQMRAEAAIPVMVGLFRRIDEEDDEYVQEDMPNAFGRIGSPAIPQLEQYLEDGSHPMWARLCASSSLAIISVGDPEARSRVVGALIQALEKYENEDPTYNAFLIDDLIRLKAVEAAPLVEKAFASDKIDQSVFGDWEDFQVRVGLLEGRQTSRTRHTISPFAFMDGEYGDPGFDVRDYVPGGRGNTKEDQKTKKKRKQAAKSRKANRKKKK